MFSYNLTWKEEEDFTRQLELAQVGMSGVRVASALVAENKDGMQNIYFGSNIELARSKVYHAEEVVLVKAINAGFTKPLQVFVTSTNAQRRVPLCYACRQWYAYINPQCVVTVLDENFKPALTTTIHDSVKFHYESKGFIS